MFCGIDIHGDQIVRNSIGNLLAARHETSPKRSRQIVDKTHGHSLANQLLFMQRFYSRVHIDFLFM
jgi:hypothetical protein